MSKLKNYTINKEDVLSVYSGKRGCMCGCRGKYRYSSQNRELASKSRGRKVEEDEISDRAITMMVNRFNKMEEVQVNVSKEGEISDYVYLETSERINCIYLKEGTMKNVKL